jgi:DNA-binding NarL/FixJ family response regulator
MHGEEHYAVRALRAGASGYLTKEKTPQELVEAIRRVHRGRKYLSVEVAERLAWEIEAGVGKQPHELLSDREYQIFLMLGAAKSVTGIAGELSLSPKTVSTYRARILTKMRLASNAELIRYAIENGISD